MREGKELPTKTAYDRLEFVFSPAIESGRNIVTVKNGKRRILSAAQIPAVTDRVTETFSVDGKRVTIDIGLLNNEKMNNGPFWLIFGHRVIASTSIGTGCYTAQGVGGRITLHEEWKSHLTKNKDDIATDTDELDQMILDRIEPLLKEAQQQSETFESELLLHDLEEMINTAVQTQNRKVGRAKRKSRKKATGTVDPTGKGSRHKSAERVNETPERDVVQRESAGDQPAPRRGLRIKWYESDGGPMGRFDTVGSSVMLNTAHKYIRRCREDNDRLLLMSAAVVIIADHQVRHPNGKPVLKFAFDSFVDAFSALITSTPEVDHATAT